jgi:hypothetical protein
MNYEQAAKWLRAIGGTHVVERDNSGNEIVVVSVVSAIKGPVSQRAIVDTSLAWRGPEELVRRAFVFACQELKAALE